MLETLGTLVGSSMRNQPVQAYIAKSKLESEGVDCWIADDVVVTLNWFQSQFLGGVKLRVRERDAKKARLVLEETVPAASGEEAEHETEPLSIFARARRLVFIVSGPNPKLSPT